MAEFTVVIGNKNYSSWSLRGWLMARIAGIEFDEVMVPLDLPETAASIKKHSPSGKVPVLVHRGLAVWESLSIAEYLNDLKPEALLWPSSQAARAHARSISAEMHAGFAELRKNMPMNIRSSYPGKGMNRPCVPTSSASPACGATAASASAAPSRRMTASCSAPLALPTRCSPRW